MSLNNRSNKKFVLIKEDGSKIFSNKLDYLRARCEKQDTIYTTRFGLWRTERDLKEKEKEKQD